MLTILDSDQLIHPNLEMIFTSEEETSMAGAKNIDLSNIKSNRIISFDAFSDDIINCGCASNLARVIQLNTKREQILNTMNKTTYTIRISGFRRRSFR